MDKVKNFSHQVPGGGVIGRLSDYTRRKKLPGPCSQGRGSSVGVLLPQRAALSTFRWGCGYATPFDISHSFPTATSALSLGAVISLSYLADFPGPSPSSITFPGFCVKSILEGGGRSSLPLSNVSDYPPTRPTLPPPFTLTGVTGIDPALLIGNREAWSFHRRWRN